MRFAVRDGRDSWISLAAALALAANSVYVPLHLLAEDHLGVEAAAGMTGAAAPAHDQEHHSGIAGESRSPGEHEPHSASDHRLEAMPAPPQLPAAVPALSLTRLTWTDAAAARPRPFIRPVFHPPRLPDQAPRHPRGPPLD